MSEGKRSDGQRGRDSATPRRLKKNKISRACFGLWRDASTRPTTRRSISRAGRVERGRGVGGGRLPRRRRASRDIDPRSRAASLRAASPETRVPRGALARRRPTRPFEKHRFYRRASHLRPGTGHATRGRGAGGHRQAAEQAVRGTRRARERHGVTRVASHAAHSRVPGARKGTGHLEAREPRVRIPESGWVPSAPGGGTSH